MNHRFFPPEWAPQSAVLIAWPRPNGDFARWYPDVEQCYLRIAESITRHQDLIIACDDDVCRNSVCDKFQDRAIVAERVHFVSVPYDDVWVRDTAPLTVETPSGPLLLDFRFNAWGAKYACTKDAAFAYNLCRSGLFGDTERESVDFVLEGGSIETDGAGTLLTTGHCLLNPNRNPSYTKLAIEAVLREQFGLRRVLWLNHGEAEGDDTDAHIDTLARFCDSGTIAYTACDDPSDPHYPALRAMETELHNFQTDDGNPYRLIPLPIPQPIIDETGARLPATYANYLVINGAVLLPTYGDPNDETAHRLLAAQYTGREILPIDCRPLIHQYGSLHCMTMQFPASLALKSP